MSASLTNSGQAELLKRTFQGKTAPATYNLGLTNTVLTKDSVLSDAVAGEPATSFGYARITLAQNNTDWPTVALDAGDTLMTSKTVTWTASGGTIGPYARVFMTDQTLLLMWWDTATTQILTGNSTSFVARIKEV
jgi:hypothetical protein